MHEAHRQQHQIGIDHEFAAGHRLELRIDLHAMQLFHLAVFAGEFLRQHRELPLRAFLMTR
jgi:hypothetical protein